MKGRIFTAAATLGRPAASAIRSSPTLTGYLSLTALSNVIVLVVNLGSGIVQARALGPEGRGELTVAMLWPTLIAGVGGLGLWESVSYYAATEGPRQCRVLATALAIGLPQTLAIALIAWSILPVVLHGKPPQVLSETRFYLWLLPLYSFTLSVQGYLQGRLAMGWFNATILCTAGLSTAMLIGLWISQNLTVHSALVAALASWAITVALCLAILLRRRDLSWSPSLRLVRPLLWFGFRRHVGSIAILVLQQRLDLIVLAVVLPTAALGTYAVASSAGMVASTFPLGASFVLYPAFARQTAATLPFAMARFLLIGALLTAVAGPVLLVSLPLAVPYVFGPAFESARPLTALLALGYLIRGWNLMLGAAISGSGKPFTASLGQAVEFSALAVLLAILIPRFGMPGGAIAVLLAAAASFICLLGYALFITKLTPIGLTTLWGRQIRGWRQLSVADYLIRPGRQDQ